MAAGSNSSGFTALAYMVVASALATVCYSQASNADGADACANVSPPAGAQSLGYTRRVFCVIPTTADISLQDSVSTKLYSGQWYANVPPPMSLYGMSGKNLVIDSGGGVTTQTKKSLPGSLPLLSAATGFYVEFAEYLSDNDPDHFPAVWLMPQEHNAAHADHDPNDPPGLEKWMELDVDEGGFNTGHHGTMISWSGNYPNYQHQNFDNVPSSTFGMDRTQLHVFGLSYDPVGKKVSWWTDGVPTGSVSTASVPPIVNSHHYYLLINNQSHGLHRPYKMYVSYFSAWSGLVVPNPPSGVQAKPGK
jgi:hypothetical protein